jgi:hypothetical protein
MPVVLPEVFRLDQFNVAMGPEAGDHTRFAGGHNWMHTISKRRAASPAFRNSVPTCFPREQAAAINTNVARTNTVIWNFLIKAWVHLEIQRQSEMTESFQK